MKNLSVLLILCYALFLCGCGSFFNIGAEKGYCEEFGCDYADAGVCGDPYEILQNKEKARKNAYLHIQCDCNGVKK